MNFKNYYLKEFDNTLPFKIPPKIVQNYKIIGDLSNIQNWKAKIVLGNSLSNDQTIRNFDDIFYVLIDLNSNYIIPVSRGDEHQTGYDLLVEYLYKKKLVSQSNYISIQCNPSSTHFIYRSATSKDPKDQKYVADQIEALNKFLLYGGNKHLLRIQAMGGNYLGDVEDYLKRKGNIDINKGQLAKIGQEIIDGLEYISKEYLRFDKIEKTLHRDIREGDIIDLFTYIKTFLKKFLNYNGYNDLLFINYDDKLKKYLNDEKIENWIKSIEGEEHRLVWRLVINYILSANGLKNNLHACLKLVDKENEKSGNINSGFEKVFGDVKIAIQEMNRLSEI